MGLDMYLEKRVFVGAKYYNASGKMEIDLTSKWEYGEKKHFDFDVSKVSEVVLSVGYWRKANAIHGWFVNNLADGVDDCREMYVPKEKLKELLEICKKVKADHNLAPSLLPVTEGFFFGSYKYDEWYFNDIDETITILKGVMEDKEPGSYYYNASW